MVESVGKKLNQARLKRGLTIDEAAHATKLRPDKIAALEADDYSRFANNIYAKGFLQIYARFLNVDVAEFARTLDNANPISVSDYQYLSNAPTPRRETTRVERQERKPPSLAPLLVFVVLIVAGLFGSWLWTKYRQISGDDTVKSSHATEEVAATAPATPQPVAITPAPQAPAPAPIATQTPSPVTVALGTPIPRPLPQLTAVPTAVPVVRPPATPGTAVAPTPRIAVLPGTPVPSVNNTVQPPAATPRQSPAPQVAQMPPPRSSDQDFVRPTPVDPTANPSVQLPPSSGVNEVQVAAVKKTWVTVRRDDPKAAPIFEDYIYPSANPLKLKGARFFIDARDPNSVQITKNGLPYAYQAPNIPVQ